MHAPAAFAASNPVICRTAGGGNQTKNKEEKQMLLRHPREIAEGVSAENAFEAVEERTGERLGACFLFPEPNPVLFPSRPYCVRLDLQGDGAQEALLGAALARARRLCLEAGKPSRIYSCCPPDKPALLETLKAYGFKDNDGLVRMCKSLPAAGGNARLPAGCAVVKDDLSDPIEQKYFIERFNQLYQTQDGEAWLREKSRLNGFARFLSVSPTGLAGEILLWQEPLVGVIGYLQTSKRWRRMNVATYMLSLAEEYFGECGLYAAQADARARIPGLLTTLEHSGYRQEKLLMRYPGVDIP